MAAALITAAARALERPSSWLSPRGSTPWSPACADAKMHPPPCHHSGRKLPRSRCDGRPPAPRGHCRGRGAARSPRHPRQQCGIGTVRIGRGYARRRGAAAFQSQLLWSGRIDATGPACHARAPLLGTYSATKHALDAACAVADLQARPFGIRVSKVLPGQFRTALGEKSLRNYGSQNYKGISHALGRCRADRADDVLEDLSSVVAGTVEAATASNPGAADTRGRRARGAARARSHADGIGRSGRKPKRHTDLADRRDATRVVVASARMFGSSHARRRICRRYWLSWKLWR